MAHECARLLEAQLPWCPKKIGEKAPLGGLFKEGPVTK